MTSDAAKGDIELNMTRIDPVFPSNPSTLILGAGAHIGCLP